jgi:hypothetical protein
MYHAKLINPIGLFNRAKPALAFQGQPLLAEAELLNLLHSKLTMALLAPLCGLATLSNFAWKVPIEEFS